jgi:mannan endo-1,4-beta-mannosidase
MRTQHLFLTMSVFVAGVFGYAALAPHPAARPGPDAGGMAVAPTPGAPETVTSSAPPAVYDVRQLIRPATNYLGVAISGAPQDMSRVDAFAKRTGTKPNMITIFESFDDDFAANEVRNIFQYGALPIVRWEPFKQGLADIAAGRFDDYLTQFATDVKRLDLPIALTVAHEMNGHWYPWGTRQNRPKDFVAAWKHIHGVFETVGATNVIWTWTPNVVNYLPAPLRAYWPGAAYVDWVGIDGYFTHTVDRTFDGLFGPTLKQVKTFTNKPVLIVETGAEPGSMRARAVSDLFSAVSRAKDIIGFVYFNTRGSANWIIDQDPRALAVFRTHPDRADFAFTVK